MWGKREIENIREGVISLLVLGRSRAIIPLGTLGGR